MLDPKKPALGNIAIGGGLCSSPSSLCFPLSFHFLSKLLFHKTTLTEHQALCGEGLTDYPLLGASLWYAKAWTEELGTKDSC